MTEEQEQRIDTLLHDAEHAIGGARFARMMIGCIPDAATDAKGLDDKADALITDAHRLDPAHAATAWGECEPAVILRATKLGLKSLAAAPSTPERDNG